ncbi:hypothetical protein ACVNIS_22915 [Sphaerotilaceae bacterium SBD11-9]
MQDLIVALIVTGCTAYAVWVLMPAALRRGVATRLQHGRWPAPVAAFLRRHAQAPSGCGCDGCDAKPAIPAGPAGTTHTIQIHRRPKSQP